MSTYVKKAVYTHAPWHRVSINHVMLLTNQEGTRGWVPVLHVAMLCDIGDNSLVSFCKRIGVPIIPSPSTKLRYSLGVIDVSYLSTILQELKWKAKDITKAVKQFSDRIPHTKAKKEQNDEIESSVESVGSPKSASLPGKKREREEKEEMPDWAHHFMEHIEESVQKCVSMVGAQALQAYCSTDLFREDKKRAIDARIAELEPVLRRELEPRVRAQLEATIRAERAAEIQQNMQTHEVSAMMQALKEQQSKMVVSTTPASSSLQNQDEELVLAALREK